MDQDQSIHVRDINKELHQFCGTTTYYKHAFTSNVFTDGVHYVREVYKCFWLVDDILYYSTQLKNEPFQVWNLKRTVTLEEQNVINRTDTFTLTCDDGNDRILLTVEIPYSDFPGDMIKFYLVDGVLLLPSEY